MKKLILLLIVFSYQTVAAQPLQLFCSVNIDKRLVEVSYTTDRALLELTEFSDGTAAGTAREGRLLLRLNGQIMIDKMIGADAEEYGVALENGKLVYVNLNIEDEGEDLYFLTFGKSFEDAGAGYTTDSKLEAIGGGQKFPKTYSAQCTST